MTNNNQTQPTTEYAPTIRYFVEAESGYYEITATANEDSNAFLNGFRAALQNIMDLEAQGAVAFPPPKSDPIYTPQYESEIPGVFHDRPFKVEVSNPKIKPGFEGWPLLVDQITFNAGVESIDAWDLRTKPDGSPYNKHAVFRAPAFAVRQVLGLEDGYPLGELDWSGQFVIHWEVGEKPYDPKRLSEKETEKLTPEERKAWKAQWRYYNNLTGLWKVDEYASRDAKPTPEAEPASADVEDSISELEAAKQQFVIDQSGPALDEGLSRDLIPDVNPMTNVEDVRQAYRTVRKARKKHSKQQVAA